MRTVFIISLALLCSSAVTAQPRWVALPNAPTTSGKIDDFYFVTEKLGWTLVVSGSTAAIHKTTDGGLSWTKQLENPGGSRPSFRSMGFTDSLNGWVGSLNASSSIPLLYNTTDGGVTWNKVTNIPSGPLGICGISIVNNTTICGVGRYVTNTAPYFVKTTDQGQTWTVKDMSPYAGSLVDVRFFSPDTGYACGSSIEGADLSDKKALVLRTTDGGTTWQTAFQGTTAGQLCWKIFFATATTGYVSIEPFPQQGQSYTPQYLKTTNRGFSWEVHSMPQNTVNMQGIGFLSDGLRGWTGGFGGTYETTNGGITWDRLTIIGTNNPTHNLNRVRMFSDTLGYATGRTVYKFTSENVTTAVESSSLPPDITSLDQNYPNPFNPNTVVQFKINQVSHVSLKILDALGREVATLINEELDQGVYQKIWDARGSPSGTYFYRLVTPEHTETKKMVLIK